MKKNLKALFWVLLGSCKPQEGVQKSPITTQTRPQAHQIESLNNSSLQELKKDVLWVNQKEKFYVNEISKLYGLTSPDIAFLEIFVDEYSIGKTSPQKGEFSLEYRFSSSGEGRNLFIYAYDSQKNEISKKEYHINILEQEETVGEVPFQEQKVPQISDSSQTSLDTFILQAIEDVEKKDLNKGYSLKADGHHSQSLYYNQTEIFKVQSGKSHCVGMTYQIFIMALSSYHEKTKDSKVWNQNPQAMKNYPPFKECWYVNTVNGKRCYGARDALISWGMGEKINRFEDLKPGDFVNYDRKSGSGHSVVFTKFIDKNGNKTINHNKDIIGFEYFSSQGSTKGAKRVDAFFQESPCLKGDCGILKNSLIMGRALPPAKFSQEFKYLSLLDIPLESREVHIPSKYFIGFTAGLEEENLE